MANEPYDEDKEDRNKGDGNYWNSDSGTLIPKELKEDLREREASPEDGGQSGSDGPTKDKQNVQDGQSNGTTENKTPGDQLGKGYTGKWAKKGRKGKKRGFLSKFNRKRKIIALVAGVFGVGIGGSVVGIFSFINVFQLDHMLSNIDGKAFIRYQVSMDGRSTKWISTYMRLRLAEVEVASNLNPADRDNIIFKAKGISKTDPLYVWYKLMRVSKFEKDLFEKEGIKFASFAYKEGNVVKYRPAIITINDKEFKLDAPTEGEINAWNKVDPNGFNNRLRDFVEVKVLKNDKEARKAIKEAVNRNTKFYQVVKRYYLRKSIQNMTGVRDWRFFETTRDKVDEKGKSIRNKIIVKALPESTKAGKFVQCIFGITDCKGSTDPSDPANKATRLVVSEKCAGATKPPECKASDLDGKKATNQGELIKNEGATGRVLTEVISDQAVLDSAVFTKNLAAKLAGPLALVDIVDTLNTIDKAIRSGALTGMVYMAKATQAIGLYTTFGIMRDQIRTGEVTATEVNDAMGVIRGGGSGEGWDVIRNKSTSTVASAASLEPTKDKATYCGPEFQAKMLRPENAKAAREQDHWMCDFEKLNGGNGGNTAQNIQNMYKSSFGMGLEPLFIVYRASGAEKVVGWVNNAIGAFISSLLGPVIPGITAALTASGLGGTLQEMMAYVVTGLSTILGAGPTLSENAPAGVLFNHALMGASASAEFAARNQGAAATTAASAALSRQNVTAFLNEQYNSTGLFDRYLSLGNHDSVTAQGLFAVTNNGLRSTVTSTIGNTLNGSIFMKARAANDDSYAAAQFGGVETYDFPDKCMDLDPLDMTPQTSTNADDKDFDLIPSEELTWELVGNSDAFYARLYRGEPDEATLNKIKQVYNCALLDSSIRGGLGAAYNSETLDANAYGYGTR